ncbi:hypothetical protein [Actinophytocola sp.]|uniref:hypothetical protein n=1 Tax=Actinophytocola sp. TaxID=1872138 RepID=UPI002D7E4BF7|nr:hypothetical protein [Actinophytocola sp.]HET9137982.1 hypothetical protein [Actinophytocola sp.]
MSRRRSPALVSLIVSGLAVAGCSGAEDDSGGPAVAWAERVCASVEQGAQGLALPAADLTDPQAAKTAFDAYLGQVAQALDRVSAELRAAGAPPVADGQQAVDSAMGTITEIKTAIEGARTRVAALPVTDAGSFQAALNDVGTGLAKIDSVEGPTKDLKANPALNEAFGKAPACRRIDGSAD